MNRRKLMTAAATLGATSLAGCIGSGDPPRRESEVIENLSVDGQTLVIELEDNPTVESRQNQENRQDGENQASLSDLSPVGVASAKGRGSGAGGRGAAASAAATGAHGRAKWNGGGNYWLWYTMNGDGVDEREADIAELGVGYLGSSESIESSAPGPGPIDWDQSWNEEIPDEPTEDLPREGWYRVGYHLVSPNGNYDYNWGSVDFEYKDGEVQNQWKVSPRL